MIFKKIFVYPKYPENLRHLYLLACNLWCTWNYEAISLFYRIDTRLFREVDHNPLKFMHCLSKKRLKALANDKGFLFELQKVWKNFQHYLEHAGTFKDECADQCDLEQSDIIAYFSMEFGLHESIPIYAGGLGVLSGDLLKGVSDMDMPVVGIGLLYKFGYFTQRIDMNGYQQEVYSTFENHLIPIRELHDPQGNNANVEVKILDEIVKVKLWIIDVGKTKLILLDTDIEANPPHLRDITYELYAGDREKRIQQELVLGIGGVRALDFLGIKAKIYHINEGHSAFAIIGRLQQLLEKPKTSFSEAKSIIRASTVFTTHTPVIAGNEHFDTELVKKYLEPKFNEVNLSFDQIGALGYVNNNKDVFWLPAFAMKFSQFINAVSKQHAQMSRKMWANIYPENPTVEIPITYITNGVHISWISHPFTDLFNRYIGPDYIHCGKREDIWKNVYNIPDDQLWEEHRRNKKDLVNFIRRQFVEQMITRGYSLAKLLKVNRSLNTEFLTIVFARRFAAYKRPTLILKDKQRLKKILTDSSKPVQLIFAGKAHPADEQSKQMIKEIIDFAKEFGIEDRVIFLENYDINIARHLYWGADVWLNYPAADMEASGTSGMKAAMNGVLHLSTLEGWWLEGFDGNNGWAITAGRIYDKPQLQETADANQLYDLLENQITELYYNRNESDIPSAWVKMMKDSIYSVCRNFNTNRVLCDYLLKFYIPSKNQSAQLAANNYKLLKHAVIEEKEVLKYWDDIKLVSFLTNFAQKEHLSEGQYIEIDCGIEFGQAVPELFTVELFYMFDEQRAYKILPMEFGRSQDGVMHYKYSLKIEGDGSQSLNVRIKPANKIVQDIHPELIKWKD